MLDCQSIIHGTNGYRRKCLSLDEKSKYLHQIFRDLYAFRLLDYVTEDAKGLVSLAEQKVFKNYDEYVKQMYG